MFIKRRGPDLVTADSRVVRLESAPRHGIVWLGQGGLKEPGAGGDEGVLGGRLVDGVADPGVPAGLDLGGVVVVLCVVDPAGAEGQLLGVFVELVAGAVLADEGAVLGVACVALGLGEGFGGADGREGGWRGRTDILVRRSARERCVLDGSRRKGGAWRTNQHLAEVFLFEGK